MVHRTDTPELNIYYAQIYGGIIAYFYLTVLIKPMVSTLLICQVGFQLTIDLQ